MKASNKDWTNSMEGGKVSQHRFPQRRWIIVVTIGLTRTWTHEDRTKTYRRNTFSVSQLQWMPNHRLMKKKCWSRQESGWSRALSGKQILKWKRWIMWSPKLPKFRRWSRLTKHHHHQNVRLPNDLHLREHLQWEIDLLWEVLFRLSRKRISSISIQVR